jgi:CBS domain-containing membrane protein
MAETEPRVEDVMQSEVVTLQRSDRLDLADDIMRLGRIRHMPVLASGRIVGIVSNRDLLAAGLSRALEFDGQQRRAFLHSVEVTEVMSEEVVTIAPEAPVREAAEKLVKQGFGCLPVVKSEGTFVGLVTETDLIRAAWLEGDPEAEKPDEGRLSGLGERIEREVEGLQRVRDELRVQIHLGRAEARDLFEGLEQRWHELETRIERVAGEARRPMQEAGDAVRDLVVELKDGYRKIRDSL